MTTYSPALFNPNSFLPPSNYDTSPTNSSFWSSTILNTPLTPSPSKSLHQGISWDHEDETDFLKSLEPFYQDNLQWEDNNDSFHISDARMSEMLIANGARSLSDRNLNRPAEGIRLVDIDLGKGSDDRSEDLPSMEEAPNDTVSSSSNIVTYGKNRKRKFETSTRKLETIVEETPTVEIYAFKSNFPTQLHTLLRAGNDQDEIYPLLFWDSKGMLVFIAMQNFETNRRIIQQTLNLENLPNLYCQFIFHGFERLPPSILHPVLAKAGVREGEFLHFTGFKNSEFTRNSEHSQIDSILSSQNPSLKPINRKLDIKVGKLKKGNDHDRNELLKVKLKIPPRRGDIVV